MYYPDVPALDPEDIELLCNEYIAHNKHLDPHIADRLGVKRGLRNPDGTGVLAGITNVSSVIGYEKLPEGTIRPIPGRLVYRGIDIDTLAAEADKNDRFMFEEVVWLLLFGALPTQEQYARFCKLIDEHRELPKGFADDMIMNSPSARRSPARTFCSLPLPRRTPSQPAGPAGCPQSKRSARQSGTAGGGTRREASGSA